jgi:hypothetical protein
LIVFAVSIGFALNRPGGCRDRSPRRGAQPSHSPECCMDARRRERGGSPTSFLPAPGTRTRQAHRPERSRARPPPPAT